MSDTGHTLLDCGSNLAKLTVPAQVWNLPALSGVLLYGIPLEELLFGTAFGMYWGGVYEHFTWTEGVAHAG